MIFKIPEGPNPEILGRVFLIHSLLNFIKEIEENEEELPRPFSY